MLVRPRADSAPSLSLPRQPPRTASEAVWAETRSARAAAARAAALVLRWGFSATRGPKWDTTSPARAGRPCGLGDLRCAP